MPWIVARRRAVIAAGMRRSRLEGLDPFTSRCSNHASGDRLLGLFGNDPSASTSAMSSSVSCLEQ
jgi:hypothetical protein